MDTLDTPMHVNDSDRLCYEQITDADADFLFELAQDPDVMRFINGGNPTSKVDIETIFLPRLAAYANPALGWGLWKVSLKAENSPAIGWVLVRPMGFFTSEPDLNNLELGWRFKQAYWGKGYASEAAKSIRDALFKSGVSTFSAIAIENNFPSIAIMKKLGMEYSHTQRYTDSVFDEDVVVYTQTQFGE